jgi:hypothetical protein
MRSVPPESVPRPAHRPSVTLQCTRHPSHRMVSTREAHRPSVPHAGDVSCSASWALFLQVSRAALLDIPGVLGSARPDIRVTFGLPQLNLTYLRLSWPARGPRPTNRFRMLPPPDGVRFGFAGSRSNRRSLPHPPLVARRSPSPWLRPRRFPAPR